MNDRIDQHKDAPSEAVEAHLERIMPGAYLQSDPAQICRHIFNNPMTVAQIVDLTGLIKQSVTTNLNYLRRRIEAHPNPGVEIHSVGKRPKLHSVTEVELLPDFSYSEEQQRFIEQVFDIMFYKSRREAMPAQMFRLLLKRKLSARDICRELEGETTEEAVRQVFKRFKRRLPSYGMSLESMGRCPSWYWIEIEKPEDEAGSFSKKDKEKILRGILLRFGQASFRRISLVVEDLLENDRQTRRGIEISTGLTDLQVDYILGQLKTLEEELGIQLIQEQNAHKPLYSLHLSNPAGLDSYIEENELDIDQEAIRFSNEIAMLLLRDAPVSSRVFLLLSGGFRTKQAILEQLGITTPAFHGAIKVISSNLATFGFKHECRMDRELPEHRFSHDGSSLQARIETELRTIEDKGISTNFHYFTGARPRRIAGKWVCQIPDDDPLVPDGSTKKSSEAYVLGEGGYLYVVSSELLLSS